MIAMGVSPNVVTYSAIIDGLVRKGGEANVEMGFALLQQMTDRGLTPNEVTFTGLLAALRRDVSLDPVFVERKREEVMARMRQAGTHFNRVTFNVLIKACLERPGREGLTSAVEKYKEMLEAGVKPTDDTFHMLLLGALNRRELDVGYDLIEEMGRIGFVAQNAVAELVDTIRKDGMSTSFTF
jgi:pentatricopeptide repeat protein